MKSMKKQSYSKTSWSNDLLTKLFKDLQKRVEVLERAPKQTSAMPASKLSYRLSCTEKSMRHDMDDILSDSEVMKSRFEAMEARVKVLEKENASLRKKLNEVIKLIDGMLDLIS